MTITTDPAGSASTACAGWAMRSGTIDAGRLAGSASGRESIQVTRQGNIGQYLYQRLADMAGAEQRDVQARRAQHFEQDGDVAAAALAERGAEGEVAGDDALGAFGQQRAGCGFALVFEVAAADRAGETLGRNDHLGAGLARGGAFGGQHRDQHGGLRVAFRRSQRVEPGGHYCAAC